MPHPFALRFRLPVTPVDRTKVVPNGNPCQIVSIMAEFLRTTVPAAPAQVLFWQKGRGETEYAKREDGKKTGGRTRAPGNYTGNLQGRPAGMGKSNRGKEGSPKNKGDRKNKSRRKGIRENIGKNRECRRRQEPRKEKLPGETGQAAGCFTGGNRGNATQTGTQEQTVKKTEIWMPRGAATTVNTAERHCGSRTMRTKKTVRTARMIQMIRSSADSTDSTDGTNWCESATQWTGRRGGESGKSRESGESGESGERIERKKQACENAGPTTRPESRSES